MCANMLACIFYVFEGILLFIADILTANVLSLVVADQ